MKQNQKILNISRVLLTLGLSIGLISWWMTISHVGDQTYLLIDGFEEKNTHAWYHAFREAVGDLVAMIILLAIFFGPDKWRTKQSWFLALMLMFGYYAPFWIGTPFVPELAAPHMMAELVHVVMASLPVIGLYISKKLFFAESI